MKTYLVALFGCVLVTQSSLAQPVFDYPIPESQYVPGSYAGRCFYCDGDHLGEDIDLPEGTPIRSIGDGELIYYKTDGNYPYGFGKLYFIVRYDLGEEYTFKNAYNEDVLTRYVCFIGGHVRNTVRFISGYNEPLNEPLSEDGPLPWPRNYSNPKLNIGLPVEVKRGDILGYIEDDLENGDGLEHLHGGLFLGYAPSGSFGYEGATTNGRNFTALSDFLQRFGFKMGRQLDGSTNQPILDAYNTNGGAEVLGYPVESFIEAQTRPETVWPWGTCDIQVFNGGLLGECAIVYDTNVNTGTAYVLHNKLWQYFRDNHGPWINVVNGSVVNSMGGPVDRERIAFNRSTVNVLSVQEMAYGYLVYDRVTDQTYVKPDASTFRIDDYNTGGSGVGGNVGIALLPGDGQNLTLLAQATTTTTVYLTFNLWPDATAYQIYRDGQQIASIGGDEYTDIGLQPGSTHVYRVVAVDANGNSLKTSADVTVTTPTETGPEGLNLTLVAKNSSIEVSWP